MLIDSDQEPEKSEMDCEIQILHQLINMERVSGPDNFIS